MNEAVEYTATFDLSSDSSTQKVVVNFVDEDNSIVGEEAFMNPANSEEFTIGYYLSRDLGMYDFDFGYRLDQIERTGSVTDEDHGDIDYFTIDDSTSSFALTLGTDLSDTLNVSVGYASVERMTSAIELQIQHIHFTVISTI